MPPRRRSAPGRRPPRRSATAAVAAVAAAAGVALWQAGLSFSAPLTGRALTPPSTSSSSSAAAPLFGDVAAAGASSLLGAAPARLASGGRQSSVGRQALEGLEALGDTSVATAFADQGQNINGVLFQASLPPYLFFLYFLGYKGNNTPPLVKFAFAFLLTFVVSTIPSGIISKSTFGVILADCDWLHGAAESLLTCTNIILVLGLRAGVAGDRSGAEGGTAKTVSGVWLALAVLTIAAGVPLLGSVAHTPFLSGLGALPPDMVGAAEPVNALSVPTWIVHWSTVFEWLIAMSLVWQYAEVSGNQRWKGLVWGMIPSHISSCAALTFHIFYNQIPWILTAQAFCTCLGNFTLAVAAARIAVSNGWTLDDANPLKAFGNDTSGEKKSEEKEEDAFDPAKLAAPMPADKMMSGPLLAFEVVALTLVFTYITKYGEPFLQIFQSSGVEASAVAAFFVLAPPLLVAQTIYGGSNDLKKGTWPELVPAGAGEQKK